MDTELAQRIALVAHGNAFLSGLTRRAPDLLAENTAFEHVRTVEFRDGRRSSHRVDLWLSKLSTRGATRILVRRNDVVVDGAAVRELWIPSSILISRGFEQKRNRALHQLIEKGDRRLLEATSIVLVEAERPWRLYYEREPLKSRVRRGSSLPMSRAALGEAVREARAFSRRHGIGYVQVFTKALSLLGSRTPVPPYHPDMLPPVGYSLDAWQVLAGATQAWVFGGMGSWGDVRFEDESVEAEFWRLNTKLRASVESALIAATNAFDGSQEGRKAI